MQWTRSLSCLLCSACSLSSAWALDEVGHAKAVDFYGSFGITVAPDVEEDATGSGGSSHYEWRDLKDSSGFRAAVGHLICEGNAQGGYAIGVELAGSTTNITPRSYDVGGTNFANTSSRTLRYTTAGALLYAGYEFGINPNNEEVSVFLFLAPFVGGGAAWADGEVRDINGTYASKRDLGFYVEGGLRLGLAATEKNWLLGVMVDGVIGTSRVKMDFGNGNSTDMTLDRLGVAAAVFVGYRL